MTSALRFSGAIPANLLPFNEDLSFDEVNYRRHLSWLAVRGRRQRHRLQRPCG